MTATLTIDDDQLRIWLYGSFAMLHEPAAKDYTTRKAILCETSGRFSSLCWKAIEPIKAGQTSVRLSDYAGHNYFRDCLGEQW